MKNEGDKTMKKVLLTSAAALAAFTVATAVSADTNLPGKYDGRSDSDQVAYYRQSDFITARRVNQYVEGHSEDIAAEKAALEKAQAELAKAENAPENFAHNREELLKPYKDAVEKAQQNYDEAVNKLRNEAVKHLQEVWNTAVQKEGKYYILNETPEQKNARYLKEHPQVATQGWVKDAKGQWSYVLDEKGTKATSWKQIDGKWYFFNAEGVMQKWWVKDGNTWYYLNGSGEMQTGWLLDGGKWYFLEASGAMKASQWFQVKDKWYHVDGSGALSVNTTVDGYTVNGNGEWV